MPSPTRFAGRRGRRSAPSATKDSDKLRRPRSSPFRHLGVCWDVKEEMKETTVVAELAAAHERLFTLREVLLQLHKALLDSERISYEAAFGHIASPYQFLHLLTNDPWFAWLAPVTQLIAAMDVALDAREPVTVANVDALVQQTRRMLVASAIGEGFSRHYDEALQRSPDVVLAHAAVAKLIRGK